LGKAWRAITRNRRKPLSSAVSIQADCITFRIAALVIRIMWPSTSTTTTTSTSTGSEMAWSFSRNPMPSCTVASDGNQRNCTAKKNAMI